MEKTTVKRISMCLTKETQRQIECLSAIFGENPSQVITRSIQMIYQQLKKENLMRSTQCDQ